MLNMRIQESFYCIRYERGFHNDFFGDINQKGSGCNGSKASGEYPQGLRLRALSGGCFPVRNLEKESKEADMSHVVTKQTEPSGNFMSSRPAFGICEKKRRTFSKTLRLYYLVDLYFFPTEGKKVLAHFINWSTKECTE